MFLYIYIRRTSYFSEKILDLERENIALLNQIEELTNQQMDRDKVIDEFGVAIDSRIAEWKVNQFLYISS